MPPRLCLRLRFINGKMLFPETETYQQKAEIDIDIPKATNVVEAMADGAMSGLRIAVAVGATLLALLA